MNRRIACSAYLAGLLVCSGNAVADITQTTDYGQVSDGTYRAAYANGSTDNAMGWEGLLTRIRALEAAPTVTTGAGFQSSAYTEQIRQDDYGYPGHATYYRVVNTIQVDLTAFSPTNGYSSAYLEYNIYFGDGTEGLIVNDSHYWLYWGQLRQPLAVGRVNEAICVIWPDWSQQTIPRTFRCTSIFSTKPRLYVSRQVAATEPAINNVIDPVGQHGDPINSVNGNVSVSDVDLVIPAAGLPLDFHRWYNTVLETDGALGPRWTHTYAWRVWETNTVFAGTSNQWLVLQAGENRHWKELSVVNGGHRVEEGWAWSWSKTNGAYTVYRPGSMAYRFDTNGVLMEIEDGFGRNLMLTYTNLAAGARLAQVAHSDGRALNLHYNGNGLLERLDSPSTNLSVRYGYSGAGLLTNATRTAGATSEATRYEWDTSQMTVTQRTDAVGNIRAWEYDDFARGIRSYVGTNRWYETELDYSAAALNRTVVTVHRDGTNVTTYDEYDPVRGKVTAVSAPVSPELALGMNAAGIGTITNVLLILSQDKFGVLSNNPVYRDVLGWVGTEGQSAMGWSGTRFTRDDYGNITAVTMQDASQGSRLENQEVLAYDAGQRVTSRALGYQANPSESWQFTWNTNAERMASIIDPESHRVEWDYTNGVVSKARNFPATNQPAETTYSYTTNGLLTSVTNANGHWVRFEHDAYGYPTTVSAQAGPTNWMTWDILGHLKEIRLPSTEYTTNSPPAMVPRVIAFDPDELGRVRKITWPDGRSETFAFDGIGNVTNHVDMAGRTNGFAWLPTRKLASTTRYLTGASNQAATVGMEYDQQMNVVKVRDELERAVETYQLDLQDRPVKVTNVEGGEMTLTYSLGDMVSKVVRFDQSSVSFSYDEGARLKTLVYPYATLDFSYLKNGLLQTASTSLGVVSNSYDGANRLILSQGVGPTPQSSTVTYQLDAVGNPTNTQVAGLDYEVRRTFNAGERISALAAGGVGATFAYNNVNGLLASMTYTNGIVCGYGYDELDRLTSMTWRDASNNVLRTRGYSYTLAGMISRVDMESGERVDYTYDSLDRLTAEKRTDPYGQTLAHDLYEYDLAGNRTKKTLLDATGTPLLTVNSTPGTGNKLASWSVAETDLVGQVDVAGVSSEVIGTNDRFGWLYVSNLTSGTSIKPYISGTNFWTYDLTVGLGTQKVVAAIRDQAGNTTRVTNEVFLTVVTNGAYQYSDAGCVTNIAYRGKDYSSTIGLTWDGQYQLVAVTTNGAVAERHGYDALGRRVWTWDAVAGTNWMVYDGAQVVADVDSTGGIVQSYVWGPGIDNLLAMTTYGGTTNTYYALKDHLNSVLALVDAAGQIVEQYRYDAWGRTTAFDAAGNPLAASAVGNRYCWQGREYSFKTGLYYFRARWYDPITGRWLSNDPIGISGGLNQYVFCANNPVNFRDPFGLAIVVNNTGSGVVISGNIGFGHGTGAQAFGVVPAGASGGGTANPITGYPTRGEAIDAANPNFIGPHRPLGPITDVDYYDDPCAKHRSSTEADNKLIGDEIGPTYDLNLKNGNIVPDAHNLTVPGAYGRRLGEKIGNAINQWLK